MSGTAYREATAPREPVLHSTRTNPAILAPAFPNIPLRGEKTWCLMCSRTTNVDPRAGGSTPPDATNGGALADRPPSVPAAGGPPAQLLCIVDLHVPLPASTATLALFTFDAAMDLLSAYAIRGAQSKRVLRQQFLIA